MDRRTVVTGGVAALLGAIGIGRVVRQEGGAGPAAAPPATVGPVPAASGPASRPPVAPSTGVASPAESGPTVSTPGDAVETTTASPTVEPAPDPTVAPATEPTTPEPEPAPTPGVAGPTVLPLLCRDAWQAAPAGDGLEPHRLRRMTIHHTAVVLDDNAKAPARLRQHQRYHQDQGWPDIAYHVSVDRNGHLYELRTTSARGDTFTSYDPSGHLLVLAEGNFDQQAPSAKQLEGLAQLLAWGHTRFGLPLDSISGHRDHAGTSCPGDALYAELPALRRRASELVAAGGVELASRCGSDGNATVAAIERGEA